MTPRPAVPTVALQFPALALALGLALGAGPAWAEGFDGAWTGTVDCPSRSIFDRGATQVQGSIVDNVLTVSFAQGSVSGRIINLGFARLLRLNGSVDGGRQASFDGVRVTTELIHARGLVGDTPCNLNLTPAGASVANAPPPRARQPDPAPARPPGKPADAQRQDRPRPGATISVPDPIERSRPVPGATIQREAIPAPAPPPAVAARPPIAAPPPPAAVGSVTPAPPLPPTSASELADQLACALAGTCNQAPAPR